MARRRLTRTRRYRPRDDTPTSTRSWGQWGPRIRTILKIQLLGVGIYLLPQSYDASSTYSRSLSSSSAYPLPDLLVVATNTAEDDAPSTRINSHLIQIPHHNQPHQSLPSDPLLELQMKAQPHDLRLDWSNLTLVSPLAQRIRDSQTICPSAETSSTSTKYWIHHLKRNGLGQMLHQWSQSVCNAMQAGNQRVLTRGAFVWMHASCQAEFDASYDYSPLSCYFGPHHELHDCPSVVRMPTSINDTALVANTTTNVAARACDDLLQADNLTVSQFRAASMEWLFSRVTPLVVENARKQLKNAFGAAGLPDRDHMVTVHIRWGDKAKEMKLKPIREYITAVHDLVGRDKTQDPSYPLYVYVASEDVNARQQFQQQAPAHWWVYWSGPHVLNRRPAIRQNANGHKGLESLGALLLAMESNYYVLTTKSNWSRLMNELRLNVVDPRCNGCTKMKDLIYGEW